MALTRRDLLGGAAAGATLLSIPSLASGGLLQAPTPLGKIRRRPKNIIFCVVDGMAIQTLTIADYFQQRVHGHRSYWHDLLAMPGVRVALEDTRSLSSIVTDSAAASSTWGSGRRIWNRMLNIYPDGTELRPIASLMKEKGVKTGLVTTTTMTHATPAGFAVSSISRELEPLIAEKYLTSGVDILLGGGDKFFNAEARKDKLDLYSKFASAGFEVVKTRDQLLGRRADRILGIFSDSHLPFSIDRAQSPELLLKVPTLAEMAQTAIDNLKGNRDGFLLQIEGGKVDHAAHSNDLAGMIHDQIAFEEAVKVAIDFAKQDGNTLVIITADHATGGPSLNGAGDEYSDSPKGIQALARFKGTYGEITGKLGKTPSAKLAQDVVEEVTGIGLKAEEAQAIADSVQGKHPFALSQFHKSVNATLAMVLGNYTKVLWTSGNHTNDHVIVTAFGPGSEAIGGVMNNTDFFGIMTGLKGIRHENPTMSYEDAAKAAAKLDATIDQEWFQFYCSHDECGCEDH